ncbi:MAG: hypothetical protein WDA09_11020 [Bacteriovoracaceae bacterium]
MKGFILSIHFLLFSSLAMAQLERKDVENILPSELVKTLKDRDLVKVEKTFEKKINSKEADALYLDYFGKKNDVTLGIKDKKVSYLYVRIPTEIQKKQNDLFDKAYDSLTQKEQEALNKKIAEDSSHGKGQFTTLDLPKKSMRLEFFNDEKRTLRSILLWPEGEKLP